MTCIESTGPIRGAARSENANSELFRCHRRHAWANLRPVHAGEQQSQLRGVQRHRAVAHRRPCEGAALQPLRDETQTGAIPDQQLQAVGPPRSKNENIARERIGREHLRHKRGQGIHTLTEVDRFARDHDPQARSGGNAKDHACRPMCVMTRRNTVASTDPEKRARMPPHSISSVPGRVDASASTAMLRGGLARSLLLSVAGTTPSTRSGTKTDLSSIALRRQVCNSPRLTPNRRATSATLTSGRVLSATIAAFSSIVHRRRRTVPVISSIRRYPSASCLL